MTAKTITKTRPSEANHNFEAFAKKEAEAEVKRAEFRAAIDRQIEEDRLQGEKDKVENPLCTLWKCPECGRRIEKLDPAKGDITYCDTCGEAHGATGSVDGRVVSGNRDKSDLESCFIPQSGDEKWQKLWNVLERAFLQAARGKGKERHATGQNFEDQPIMSIHRLLGTDGGFLYQAIKKTQESRRLPTEKAVAERLGAINYLAASIIWLEEKGD